VEDVSSPVTRLDDAQVASLDEGCRPSAPGSETSTTDPGKCFRQYSTIAWEPPDLPKGEPPGDRAKFHEAKYAHQGGPTNVGGWPE
jgi:hypothetical protein